jgi:hypothetical protein
MDGKRQRDDSDNAEELAETVHKKSKKSCVEEDPENAEELAETVHKKSCVEEDPDNAEELAETVHKKSKKSCVEEDPENAEELAETVHKKICVEEDPDKNVAPMQQLLFGTHVLNAEYRRSLPCYYTVEMVISTFLGHNQQHPSQEEWLALQDEFTDSSGDDSDSDWKKSCSSDTTSTEDSITSDSCPESPCDSVVDVCTEHVLDDDV